MSRIFFCLSALLGLTLFVRVPSLGASTTTGGLQARASAIAATIERDDELAAATGRRYLAEHLVATNAQHRVQNAQGRIAQLNLVIARQRNAVRQSVIAAYVNAGNDTNIGLLLENTPDQVSVGQTYLSFATRQLQSSVSVLSDDEHTLSVESATEVLALQSAQQAESSTSLDRANVLSDLNAQQTTLSSVNGQLAALVAQQAAARAAAEAAAKAQAAGPPALDAVALSSDPIPAGSLAAAFAGIRNCESSGDYSLDSGNGYYGAYQFSAGTWESLGGVGLASQASPQAQDAAAFRLYQRSGFSPWPASAAILGLS